MVLIKPVHSQLPQQVTSGSALAGRLAQPYAPAHAAHDPLPGLHFSRPHGRFNAFFLPGDPHRNVLNHAIRFNRPASTHDLAMVTPKQLDEFDRAHYRFEGHLAVSRVNPRFVAADINAVNAHAINAMLALDTCLTMRTELWGTSISVYLMGPHTWALWGWVEAMERGELKRADNTLLHIDDHDDLAYDTADWGPICRNDDWSDFRQSGPTLKNIDRLMKAIVFPRDQTGIDRFIVPAFLCGLISDYWWIYDAAHPTVERREITAHGKLWAMHELGMRPDIFDKLINIHGVLPHWAGLLAFERPLVEVFNHPPTFRCVSNENIFEGRMNGNPYADAALRDYIRSSRHRRLASPETTGDLILDIDVDVSDDVEDLVRVLSPHLSPRNCPSCITIAMSPEYGASENHVEKTLAVLDLIRQSKT